MNFDADPTYHPPKIEQRVACLNLYTRTDANGLEENGQVARDVADGGKDVTHGAAVVRVCVRGQRGRK